MQKTEQKIRLGVVGFPIEHSLSPQLYNHWMKSVGINGCYKKLSCEPRNLTSFIKDLKDKKYYGWNVTVPHKTTIGPLLDSMDETALQIGAVNTVKNEGGRLRGYNTDGHGFIRHLNSTVTSWRRDMPVLVLGSGGAARAVIAALHEGGVDKIYLCNRTKEKAEAVKKSLGLSCVEVVNWDEKSALVSEVGLVVNTTPLGMKGTLPLDISLNHVHSDVVVYDIVYNPLETPLIKAAKDRGLKTVDGLGMLYYQAAVAFEIWFGQTPDLNDGLLDELREQFL